MTTAIEMLRLYRELADLPSTGSTAGGKPKSKPPIGAEALDLRKEYEVWVGSSSSVYVQLALSGEDFATWADTWVQRCKVLTGELRPSQRLWGAECPSCEQTEAEPRVPAITYHPDTRYIVCSVCDWYGQLPKLG